MEFHFAVEGQIVKRDPEVFATANGNQGVRFELAHKPTYRDASGQWAEGRTQFFDIVAWGQLADNVLASFKRYDQVLVTARGLYAHESGGFAHLKVTADNVAASLRFGTATPERKPRDTTQTVRTADGEDLPGDDAWNTATPAAAAA
ncbi:single-stranded DNA-binding protein [Glycomyces salinus]|uniref:single-stranded DNA-binding protein n=1 Tax=Glycomyces salinus TaxID=980294 RepID=UPI0018EE036F|nr:single-stranded DNA-binding protein [Glycomyces salinus]